MKRPPALHATVATASVCAFAMIATQVAGKATRDALFLTSFDISALPVMLMVSALVSIGAVLLTSRLMTRFGPPRIIPPFFAGSAILLAGEWLLATSHPRPASVILYLHIAALGSILISGFWSIVNERFDPRTAKQSIGRIAGGATLGGLFGGFLAERTAAYTGILWMIPVIALFHLLCAFLLLRLRPVDAMMETLSARAQSRAGGGRVIESGFRVLRRSGYLRNLALLVLLGNVSATLIDFLFKSEATRTYATDADLMRFFAVFYTAVSLVTFTVQAFVTRPLLEHTGIANTVSVRSAAVTGGGLIALPFMGLAMLGVIRGLEAVIQGSLFRSSYELLYTPVSPDKKRATKTIVDVGADRTGDIVGGAMIRTVILLPAAIAGHALMMLAIVVALAAFLVARSLHRGYIGTLEKSLIDRADVLDIGADDAPGVRTMMMESFTGIDITASIDGIRLADLREAARASSESTPAAREDEDVDPVVMAPIADPELALLIELRSGDAARVRRALRSARSASPLVASEVIRLLAWDEMTGWASRVLAKSTPQINGQLVDRLLDPDEEFAIRRRVPRILATSATPLALEGLLAALADKRFEVRYQSARALAKMQQRQSSLPVKHDAVYAAVLREIRIERPLWERRQLLDEPEEDDQPVFLDEALRARASRSLEHIFTILSLVVPREPLQIAFKALLTSDSVLRGTGLEYLESVLPRDIWDRLHPFLDDSRGRSLPDRPREEVLDDLMRSSQSIDLSLAELKKRLETEP